MCKRKRVADHCFSYVQNHRAGSRKPVEEKGIEPDISGELRRDDSLLGKAACSIAVTNWWGRLQPLPLKLLSSHLACS